MSRVRLMVCVAMAVSALVITGCTEGNPAVRLVEAANLTNDGARELGESYTEIVPLTDEEGNPIVADPAQINPRYERYTSSAEHEVRDAMEFLRRLQEETGPIPQTEYLAAVQSLKVAWQPRYDKAVADYKQFADRLHTAEGMSAEYFQVQAGLTAQIINSNQRRSAELQDFREREVYLNWRAQAHSTLARARLIKQDLDDLNVIITKLELSANFAALYQDFQELPTSLLTLHAEIDKFRAESEMINQTFGAGALTQ